VVWLLLPSVCTVVVVFYLSLLRCINALAIDMVGLSRCLLVLCVQAFVEGRR
jgi:hypothetical protein